jgi:FkbM family methyltransferase
MQIITALSYYLSSIPRILHGIANWPQLFRIALRREPAVVKLRGGPCYKVRGLMDVWIVKETCLDKVYETGGTRIENGWTVVDVGAGLGDFAIFEGSRHPASRVLACEPFPQSFDLMRENISLNGVRNVTALPVAIGATCGTQTLATTGQAVQHTTTGSTLQGAASSTLEVECLSLDEFFRLHGIGCCDFLKMDCEGGEYEILLGAGRATLQRINHISLEYHDGFTANSHEDLVKHLRECGFAVTTIPNPVHSYLGYLHASRGS